MRLARAFAIAAALVLGLSGCQAMFTTSLGSALVREYSFPSDISNKKASDILDSNPSPEACAALLDVLNAQAATSKTSAGLAVEAAIGASEMTTKLGIESSLESAMNSGTAPSGAELSALVTSLQGVVADPAVAAAFARLDSGGGTVDATVLEASGMNSTEMLLVALVVASSALGPGEDPSAMDAGQLAAFQADPKVVFAAALLGKASAGLSDPSLVDSISGYLNVPVTP